MYHFQASFITQVNITKFITRKVKLMPYPLLIDTIEITSIIVIYAQYSW